MSTGAIITNVVTFIVRQFAKYGAENVKWDLVRADVAERVAKLVPGDLFDPFAQMIVEKIIVLIENLCKDEKAFADIKAAIEAKNFKGIIQALIDHCKVQLLA